MQNERSLVRKLTEIMKEVGYLQKKGRNDKQKYNFIQEADVIEAVRDLMIQKNLMIFQETEEMQVTPSGTTKSGSSKMLTTIKMKYTIVDGDSGEERVISTGGQGEDMGDKGIYKATTGANKYGLLKLFQIPTGDDPEIDGETSGSQQRGNQGNQNRGGQQQQRQTQQRAAAPPSGPSVIDVENLGMQLDWPFEKLMEFVNALRTKNGQAPVKDVLDLDPQWIAAVYNALQKKLGGGK